MSDSTKRPEMPEAANKNEYAHFLKEMGNYVITVDGVDWYLYNGFITPAYLPHCCPPITNKTAEQALNIAGKPFARWDTNFGQIKSGEWWYVLKRGLWDIETIKDKKKRWMIRQGKKQFSVRILTSDEILTECPRIAKLATTRYKGQTEIETRDTLEKQVAAAKKLPGVLEYIGCFYEDRMVSISENYIQNNAVWLATMRHDPAYLNKYSSYGFLDGILDYYLNHKKMDYVLDGCRRLHHRTNFQDYLIKVFGFSMEYAVLNVIYERRFRTMVNIAYPFRNLVWYLCDKWVNGFLDNIGAVLRQEHIRRTCKEQINVR